MATPLALGSREFCRDYACKYAYAVGAMYRGIASTALIIRAGNHGVLSYFGAGGLPLATLDAALHQLTRALGRTRPFGMNLLCNVHDPELEEETVDLYLTHGVANVEAAGYVHITPALVRYCVSGLARDAAGAIRCNHRILAKVSRPEVAKRFLSPAPDQLVRRLVQQGKISREQAELAAAVPMADDICVESDSGGHTDMGVAIVLLPAIIRLRDEAQDQFGYRRRVRVGAAGGIGTPQAAAAMFLLGADFVVTGSINQCTAEAGISDVAKDMLQNAGPQDTAYAVSGDMFELGAKIQVLKSQTFFAARANRLHQLYLQHDSLEAIEGKSALDLQEKIFRKSFADVFDDIRQYLQARKPAELDRAERNPRHKMALVFRWYFDMSSRAAISGDAARRLDFQIHCGPALGAFNQLLKSTDLECWRRRHVDDIADYVMTGASEFLNRRSGHRELV
jgi:trans-AT polyketide synthase/acyltransferase/oxidoreductase domain-containing protein